MCGDTLVLPKTAYNDNVTTFINTFKPPGLEDFTFHQIDDSLDPNGNRIDETACWIAQTYSRSSAARLAPSGSWALVATLVAVAAATPRLL